MNSLSGDLMVALVGKGSHMNVHTHSSEWLFSSTCHVKKTYQKGKPWSGICRMFSVSEAVLTTLSLACRWSTWG